MIGLYHNSSFVPTISNPLICPSKVSSFVFNNEKLSYNFVLASFLESYILSLIIIIKLSPDKSLTFLISSSRPFKYWFWYFNCLGISLLYLDSSSIRDLSYLLLDKYNCFNSFSTLNFSNINGLPLARALTSA